MTVYKGSRYEGVEAIEITNEEGEKKRLLKDRNFTNFPISETIRYSSDDELDLSAFIEYGDERLWWVIADANRDNLPIEDLLDIESNTKIKLPASSAVQDVY